MRRGRLTDGHRPTFPPRPNPARLDRPDLDAQPRCSFRARRCPDRSDGLVQSRASIRKCSQLFLVSADGSSVTVTLLLRGRRLRSRLRANQPPAGGRCVADPVEGPQSRPIAAISASGRVPNFFVVVGQAQVLHGCCPYDMWSIGDGGIDLGLRPVCEHRRLPTSISVPNNAVTPRHRRVPVTSCRASSSSSGPCSCRSSRHGPAAKGSRCCGAASCSRNPAISPSASRPTRGVRRSGATYKTLRAPTPGGRWRGATWRGSDDRTCRDRADDSSRRHTRRR